MRRETPTPPAREPKGTATRRDFLRRAGGVAALAGLGPLAGAASPATSHLQGELPAPITEAFRFVFLPDIHLMDGLRAPEGMAAALDAASRLDPRPAFLVTGGDLIDNLRDKNLDDAIRLADAFLRIWGEHTELPAYHLLGNHDAAGWREGDIPPDDPRFGWGLLREKLGMESLYYSFNHGGWHFAALHNLTLTERGQYVSEFPDEQLAFLRDDLRANQGRPTILFGHFPPVSAIEFFDGRAERDEDEERWTLAFQRAARNPMALVEAMDEGDVKAFLSGHIHRLDRIEAMGHTFICAGSVSGAKWTGHDHGTPEGFAVVDCHADGTFEYAYHDYGWTAADASEEGGR